MNITPINLILLLFKKKKTCCHSIINEFMHLHIYFVKEGVS